MRNVKIDVAEGPGMRLSGARRTAFNRLNERVYNQIYRLRHVERCFCGGGDFVKLSQFDRFGLPFGTRMCRACGLISLDSMLAETDLSSFYEDIYWPLIAGSATPSYQTAQRDFSGFSDFVRPHLRQGAVVFMEAGCGSGIRLSLLRSLVGNDSVRLVGCDYSGAALKVAADRGIDVRQGGMESLKSAGKADVLVLSHVFEHLPDLRRALDEIAELTHHDSIVYIEVPGVVDLENKKEYGFDYQDYCVLAHVHNFSLATLTSVLRSGGFELAAGNEYVRAIFSQRVKFPQAVTADPCEQILAALERARSKSNSRRRSVVRRLRRALAAARDEY